MTDLRRDVENFLNSDREKRVILGINSYSKQLSEKVGIGAYIDESSLIQSFEGVPVIKSIQEISKSSVVVCASTMKPVTAKMRLKSFGFDSIHIFDVFEQSEVCENYLKYWYEFRLDFSQYRSIYERLYSRLSDEESRIVFNTIINSRLRGNVSEFSELLRFNAKSTYMESFLKLKDINEVFYDCGAFDGSDSMNFFNHTSLNNQSILFEPNELNNEIITNKLNFTSNYQVLNLGLGNVSRFENFNSKSGTSSKFTSNGDSRIQISKIDELNLPLPTFIKMDIEGMEPEALNGAIETIKKSSPKLAICIYHKYDDMRKIFLFIEENYNNYSLYLRHYLEGIHETVLFVVPA